jgi:hypothetical protein
MVGLSTEKAASYLDDLHAVVECPQWHISKAEFQKLHGHLTHASQVMPCMSGFMSEMNKVLASAHITMGLGYKAPIQETLEDFAYFLEQAHLIPSHFAEIFGTNLPHIWVHWCVSEQNGQGHPPSNQVAAEMVWRCKFPLFKDEAICQWLGASS